LDDLFRNDCPAMDGAVMPHLLIREIMDDLNDLGGMTSAHLVLITELVAVCLAARPQPVTFGDDVTSHRVTPASPLRGAERTKRWRERKKEVSSECDAVTSPVINGAIDSNITLQSGKGVVGGKPSVTSPVTKRGTRLPDDWNPSETLWTWGKEKLSETDLRFETAAFKDFWAAKPGAHGCKLDWDRTWKVWMREALRRLKRFQPKQNGPARTAPLQFKAEVKEVVKPPAVEREAQVQSLVRRSLKHMPKVHRNSA
jgi:hypothetical protein